MLMTDRYWSEATKMRNSALRPTCAPKRLHQEQDDWSVHRCPSGLERSDKNWNNNRPTWPCDRAVLNPS